MAIVWTITNEHYHRPSKRHRYTLGTRTRMMNISNMARHFLISFVMVSVWCVKNLRHNMIVFGFTNHLPILLSSSASLLRDEEDVLKRFLVTKEHACPLRRHCKQWRESFTPMRDAAQSSSSPHLEEDVTRTESKAEADNNKQSDEVAASFETTAASFTGFGSSPFMYDATTAGMRPTDSDYRYSASDWLQNMRSIPRSSILRAIKFPVLSVVVWSTMVSIVHILVSQCAGPTIAQRMFCINSKPHSFLVSALGLLLVFRTNSAYQRFAEGRKIWESILSTNRNFFRMAVLYEKELSSPRLKRICRLLAAFPYLLHHHIQPKCDPSVKGTSYALALTSEQQGPGRRGRVNGYPSSSGSTTNNIVLRPKRKLANAATNVLKKRQSLLRQQESEKTSNTKCWVDRRKLPWRLFPKPVQEICAQSVNKPLWVCDRLGHEINQVAYTPNYTSRERLTFFKYIDNLSKCIGECERIHQTAVPLNYARHSLRSLTLWLYTLVFALVGDFGLLTGPVMGLAAWLLYGIYEIGHQIEDPFQGSLRLNSLCDAIYRDVMYGTASMNSRVSAFEETAAEREAWNKLDKQLYG